MVNLYIYYSIEYNFYSINKNEFTGIFIESNDIAILILIIFYILNIIYILTIRLVFFNKLFK